MINKLIMYPGDEDFERYPEFLKFDEIWESATAFVEAYHNQSLPQELGDDSITTLYYLLYGRYGSDSIIGTNVRQWEYRFWGMVFQYGPAWEKRLQVQKRVRELSEDDLRDGDLNLNNLAYNPGTAPATTSTEVLQGIAQQNAGIKKRSILGGYSMLESLLATDVSEEFLAHFKDLFKPVLYSGIPYLYEGGEN